MYIGEATVATICGIIFGPHAANLINPFTWGNTDQITLEFSRIVLVVQCFAVGVELPKYYMEKHWRSVVFLLVPVMTFGWLMTSLFVWWMIPHLDWLESLCVAACVTATDPVLASSVVGKGKFAKRVPKHLRDLLSAESGCNDGMAFPFIYLALYIIEYRYKPNDVAFHWFVVTILYECVFGAIYGFVIGYIGRHGIKWAEKHDLVDRESFLVFYFVLALFCAGSGSILGVDDLLVGFAAGVGFSNDGWFTQKTEESHVSNVIDLLLNLAYFVYLGTIIPWEQYNAIDLGVTPWRLVVIAIFVILFRRIPIMMALKPFIPDIKTWREALFAGHFGPIGVGAIFVAILARAELETGTTTPLADLPAPETPHYELIALIWPITTFLVISSIIVHGSSVAVFTLGKHINTLTLTMSYTQANEDGPSWMGRLPRISSQSKSMSKASDTDVDDVRMEDLPPGSLPPIGMSGQFLRRQREEDNPSRQGSRASSQAPSKRRKKKWDSFGAGGPGGPISASAIAPQRRQNSGNDSATLTPHDSESPVQDDDDEGKEKELGEVQDDPEMHEIMHHNDHENERDQHKSDAERAPDQTETFVEGDHLITENEDGDVLTVQRTPSDRHGKGEEEEEEDKDSSNDFDEVRDAVRPEPKDEAEHRKYGYKNMRKKIGVWKHRDDADVEASGSGSSRREPERKRGPALAYQFGNTVSASGIFLTQILTIHQIIVEDADGEVVKKYELPPQKPDREPGPIRQGIARMGTWTGKRKEGDESEEQEPSRPGLMRQGLSQMGAWTGRAKKDDNTEDLSSADAQRKGKKARGNDEDDDRRIRFTLGGSSRRMTKEDFLQEMRQLDPKARAEIIQQSDAPEPMKELARKDASEDSPGSSRLFDRKSATLGSSRKAAKQVAAAMAKERGADIDLEEEEEEIEKEESDESANRNRRRATKEPPREKASETTPPGSAKEVSKVDSPSTQIPETAAERRRRKDVLKGLDEEAPQAKPRSGPSRNGTESSAKETPAEKRRREATSSKQAQAQAHAPSGETAAEKRRREAALGVGAGEAEDDSDDDNTERVPQRSRGIRFAPELPRGRKK